MPLKQPTFNLTERDARVIKHAFIKSGGYLDTHFGDRAVNFRETGIGMAFVELQCELGEIYQFYINKESQEQSIITAREPDNVIQRALEMSYTPRMPTAATGSLTFSTSYTGLLIFKAGHKFRTDVNYTEVVHFESTAIVIKPAGATSVTISVREGESVTDTDRISTGLTSVKLLLEQYPVIGESVSILVDGVPWTEVENFLSSLPADKHFRVLSREVFPGLRRYYVEFGDGTNGLYPPAGSLIQIAYRVGGGLRGNVPEGNVTVSETAITNPIGSSVTGDITNADDMTGGLDEETIDDIRVNALSAIVTNSRLVSNEDYVLAGRVAGAARCACITSNEWAIVDENTIILYCSEEMGVAMSAEAQEALREHLIQDYPNNGTTRLVVGAAQYDTFVVSVRARLAQGSDYSVLNPAIQRIAAAFLSYAAVIANPTPRYVIDVGQAVHPSNLEAIMEGLEGVVSSRVLFDGVHDDFEPDAYKVPWASTVTYDIAFES